MLTSIDHVGANAAADTGLVRSEAGMPVFGQRVWRTHENMSYLVSNSAAEVRWRDSGYGTERVELSRSDRTHLREGLKCTCTKGLNLGSRELTTDG